LRRAVHIRRSVVGRPVDVRATRAALPSPPSRTQCPLGARAATSADRTEHRPGASPTAGYEMSEVTSRWTPSRLQRGLHLVLEQTISLTKPGAASSHEPMSGVETLKHARCPMSHEAGRTESIAREPTPRPGRRERLRRRHLEPRAVPTWRTDEPRPSQRRLVLRRPSPECCVRPPTRRSGGPPVVGGTANRRRRAQQPANRSRRRRSAHPQAR
jgi:hypothetical protein